LLENELKYSGVADNLKALKMTGVPYSLSQEEYDANVARFGADVAATLDINNAEANLMAQAEKGNFDGNPSKLTEMDALVAYLQVLGTMVDFNQYDESYFVNFR